MPVRNRRKTYQAAFTEAELQSALQIIREGNATFYKAAKDDGINRITLYRYISAGLGTTTSELKKKTKKRTIFTQDIINLSGKASPQTMALVLSHGHIISIVIYI